MSLWADNTYSCPEIMLQPPAGAFSVLWKCICPDCGCVHGKQWHIESDVCPECKKETMHYRNGREAKNGDKVVQLSDLVGSGGTIIPGIIVAVGVLHSATPGNDYCNGGIAPIQNPQTGACLCDCLHVEDLAAILAEKGLDKRPAGK